jgi:hypothetical protein
MNDMMDIASTATRQSDRWLFLFALVVFGGLAAAVTRPASIAANKPARLEIWCAGEPDSDVIARCSVEA